MKIIFIERHQTSIAKVKNRKIAGRIIAGPLSVLSDYLAKSQSKKGRWRIVLSDDVSYEATIPLDKSADDIRSFIADHLNAEIPEQLENHDWSYQVKGNKAIVLAPVTAVWKQLREIIQQSHIQIEGIIQERDALQKNTNPIIGAALVRPRRRLVRDLLPMNTSSRLIAIPWIIAISILCIIIIYIFSVRQ